MSNRSTRVEPTPVTPARRRRDRELWVGVFMIAGVVGVVVALFALTDASTFRNRYVATTHVADAGGVRRGDPVQLRGVNVGRIRGFQIDDSGVTLRLEIEGEYRVPRDSRVELRSGGLLEGMTAEIIPGTSDEPLRGGDSMPGEAGESISTAVERIAVGSEEILDRARTLLSDRTIAGVESTTAGMAELVQSLGRSASNLERATGPELQRSVERVDALIRRLERMTPALEGAAASVDRSSAAAEAVLGRIERGEGTLGRLTRDDALYVNATRAIGNMNRAAVELSLLSQDIRRNPGRYVKLSLF